MREGVVALVGPGLLRFVSIRCGRLGSGHVELCLRRGGSTLGSDGSVLWKPGKGREGEGTARGGCESARRRPQCGIQTGGRELADEEAQLCIVRVLGRDRAGVKCDWDAGLSCVNGRSRTPTRPTDGGRSRRRRAASGHPTRRTVRRVVGRLSERPVSARTPRTSSPSLATRGLMHRCLPKSDDY